MVDDLVVAAESAEAHALMSLVDGASPETTARLRLTGTRIGGATVTSAPGAAQTFWTRVLGLGISEPVTGELIGEIIRYYLAHGTGRTVFQIAPSLLPPDWDAIRAEHGLTPGATWYKMARPAAETPPPATSLSISRVEPDEVAEAMAVLATGFDWSVADMTGLMGGAITSGLADGYVARDGDTIVSSALLVVSEHGGAMYGAGTLPGFRGRGGQTALLAARVSAAARAGCGTVFAETWVPGEGGRNPSFENMRAGGFEVLYERPGWVWEA
ncbi:hypothetical protein ACIA8K_04345 [Catenuloplanes sp. NPDC051500]|uniref:hypothetical protein n=1 Tax=Catenuloplanes sp. NPDC051500 TaxID=3363959 RepID=UPI0037A5D34B